MHVFSAKIVGGEISFDKRELLEVRWFTPEEIKDLKLREEFIKQLTGSANH